MSIEHDLVAVINASELLKDILYSEEIKQMRFFPNKIPQGVKLPAVIFTRMGETPYHTLLGLNTSGVHISIEIYAVDYELTKDIAVLVREALAASDINLLFQGEEDVTLEDNTHFHKILIFKMMERI